MRERLFIPLGMTSAGFGAPGQAGVLDQPRGHRVDGRPVEPGPAADNPTANAPAGAVHCSVRDWAKFAAFHATHGQSHPGLLKRESFAILHAAGKATSDEPNDQEAAPTSDAYAMGWFVLSNGVLVHSGSNTFWLAKLAVIPKERLAVLVVCNQGGDEAEKGCNTAVQALLSDFHRR